MCVYFLCGGWIKKIYLFNTVYLIYFRTITNVNKRPGVRMGASCFVEWIENLEMIIDSAIRRKNIIGGFKSSGIFPCNREVTTKFLSTKPPQFLSSTPIKSSLFDISNKVITAAYFLQMWEKDKKEKEKKKSVKKTKMNKVNEREGDNNEDDNREDRDNEDDDNGEDEDDEDDDNGEDTDDEDDDNGEDGDEGDDDNGEDADEGDDNKKDDHNTADEKDGKKKSILDYFKNIDLCMKEEDDEEEGYIYQYIYFFILFYFFSLEKKEEFTSQNHSLIFPTNYKVYNTRSKVVEGEGEALTFEERINLLIEQDKQTEKIMMEKGKAE
jgi:hypothetical protein